MHGKFPHNVHPAGIGPARTNLITAVLIEIVEHATAGVEGPPGS